MERQLVSLIREFKLGDRVLLQSFSTPSLLLLRDLAPDLPRVQLIGQRLSPDSLMRVAQWAEGVGPDRRLVDSAFVRTARAAGLLIHPYTVDDTLEMDRLAALQVDGMFTNRPALLRARWRAPR